MVLLIGPAFSSDAALAIRAEKYPCYNDFFMTFTNQPLGLVQDIFCLPAVNIGAGFGYDTIAAISVAAVLNLEKGPRMALK